MIGVVVAWHYGCPYRLEDFLMLYESLPVDKIVHIVDRNDQLANSIRSKVSKGKVIEKTVLGWKCKYAETFAYGVSSCLDMNFIYVCAEDIWVDSRIFDEKFWEDSTIGVLDFGWYNDDGRLITRLDNLPLRILSFVGYRRSGVFGLRREAYHQVGGFVDDDRYEDLFKSKVRQNWKVKYIRGMKNRHGRIRELWMRKFIRRHLGV